MNAEYQFTFEDIENREILKTQPGRTAFIDESGSFGFDFSTEGNSKYYILCAVVVENKNLERIHGLVEKIKSDNGFANTEMKSNKINHKNNNRRTRIISQLLQVDFSIVLLVVDKQALFKDSPLTQYKPTFIKFLHRILYDSLYHVYPKLKIIEDEVGTNEFQESFKKYVEERRPQQNLFNEYDFDYSDSKDEVLVQLADIIGGSLFYQLNNCTAPNYREMLKSKIAFYEEFPSKMGPYWGNATPEEYKFDKDIYALAVKCAQDFISKNQNLETDDKRAQVAFLRHLLLQVKYINPTKYIYSTQILSVLREYTEQKISRDFLYRKVIAPLRDEGVIIASSSQGYKIPISVDDVKTYLNSTHAIVSPMLHRIDVCRKLIQMQTGNSLDILNDPAYVKYKKFFD